ncbi:MAG: formylglycine-generating enzyme family protein [Deltaproteobacteria bacterium]|nr:formylglycine-generating enzyme family protein [Deltaproteobacteria bacterium]
MNAKRPIRAVFLLSIALTLGPHALGAQAREGWGDTARRGPVALAAPSVIYVPAGEFVMGASAEDIERAQHVCEREGSVLPQLAWRCAGLTDPFEASTLGSLCESSNFAYITYREEGQHRVLLGPYAMDRAEVTVDAYWRCVDAGACASIAVTPGAGTLGAREFPVTMVRWHDAARYCAWAHGRLPTEAEWERAARGRDGRVFPWGNLYNPRLANLGIASATCLSEQDGYAYLAPVGSYPDGATSEGFVDLAGNAAEWVEDAFDDGPEQRNDARPSWAQSTSRYPRNTLRIAPRNTHPRDDHRIYRGGSYIAPAYQARTSYRARTGAGERAPWLGFRCAYDVW